jgi:hypothetical protein
VGDGYTVRFWHDIWCGDSLLKLCYPALFSIALYKDAWAVDYLSLHRWSYTWNVVFTRLVQDWEMEMVLSFYVRLYPIRHGAKDMLVWSLSKRGHFEVKSFYKVLASQEGSLFSWKSIRRVKASSRVSFFVWIAALGKILMHENLRRRNIVAVEWCCICKKSGKSINYLLLHCDVARDLWNYLLILFGVEWVMPRRVLDLLTSWGARMYVVKLRRFGGRFIYV